MGNCENAMILSAKVCKFVESGAMEESITDYIIWKIQEWAPLEVYSINIKKFTRIEENKETGADLEIVFIDSDKNLSLSLVIQAKVTVETYKRYCKEIGRNGGSQVETLINYCVSKGKIPLYMFYSNLDVNINNFCCRSYIYTIECYTSGCITLQSALRVKSVYKKKCQRNKKLSKYELTNWGILFSCLFCCPITQRNNPSPIEHLLEFFEIFYLDVLEKIGRDKILKKEIPEYVKKIIDKSLENELKEVLEGEENSNKNIEDTLRKYGLLYKRDNIKFYPSKILVIDLNKER
ncbi:MAG: hypothetical protein GXO21_04095 [Aquificae bacterium]|nr:hypothetical protein [Aquificota bacterium]